MKIKTDSEYKSFVGDIKKRVRASQYEAFMRYHLSHHNFASKTQRLAAL